MGFGLDKSVTSVNDNAMDYIQELRDAYCYEPLTGKLFWSKRTSNRIKQFSEAGSLNAQGYLVSSLNGKQNLIHRVIYEILLGRKLKSGECIDHIDGDKSNNRLNNIRLTDYGGNARAFRKKSHGKSSKYRGVQFDRERNSWRAAINVDGKLIQRRAKTEELAAMKYNELVDEHGWPSEAKNILESECAS